MRRGSVGASTAPNSRRSSISSPSSPRRVAFADEGRGALEQAKAHGTLQSTSSRKQKGQHSQHSPTEEAKQKDEEEEQLDVTSMEMALAFECRDELFSILSAEIDEVKRFRPSFLIPLLDTFSRREMFDKDLSIMGDSVAGHAQIKSRTDQVRSELLQKDREIQQAKKEVLRLKKLFFESLDEQAGAAAEGTNEDYYSSSSRLSMGSDSIKALLPHQNRPSFLVARELNRQETWKRWSGNQPFPAENASHLLVPDQRGVDFNKANQSALQLISIPFKPRVWLEEGAGDGKSREKSKSEEIKYDALRRRHKSLHGADLNSLNLGDFALSFPDLARAVPMLQCLDDDEIEALDEQVKAKDFHENSLIVQQGTKLSTVFFIGAGAVTCTTSVVSQIYGAKTCSHTLSKGDFFGNADKAVGTYMATGHVLLFAVPRQLLLEMMAKKNDFDLESEYVPTWDEASLIAHIEQFLQYLLMFTEEEKRVNAQRGGLNLPGGERLFGTSALTRKSIAGGRSRGGSLSTRGTISQFLAPNRSSVADDEIVNTDLKKALMFDMLSSSAPEFDLLETLDNMIRLTKDFFQVDRVGLFRINKMKSTMSLRMSQVQDSESEVPLRGIAGHIAQTGKILNIPNCYESELFDSSHDQRLGYKSVQMLCVPAFSGADNLTGVLQCINTQDGLPFTKSDETLCFMIAQQIGQTLGTVLDRETVGDYAVTHRLGPDVKLRLHLSGFTYIPPEARPRAKVAAGSKKGTRQVKEVMVKVSLQHGTTVHPVEHSSKFSPAAADGSFTLNFDAEYDLRDLPLASRLLVQIITKETLSRRPLAWCGLSLYSFERQLRTGHYTINTWDGALPEGSLAALERRPSHPEPCFLTCDLSCTSTVPVFYEVPHSARVNEERGADFHAATTLLNDSLSTDANGQTKNLAFYVDKMSADEKKRFARLGNVHPSTAQLVAADKDIIWRMRRYLIDKPNYLPAFLLAVDWLHLESVSEAYRLLHEWAPPGRFIALQLLGGVYPDPKVRAYAVEIMSSTTDEEFFELLAPLVSQLRFETSCNCALARLLLRRALNAPKTIGHSFFWQLQAGMHAPELADKCRFFAHIYMRCCGDEQRTAHAHSLLLMRILRGIAAEVAAERGGTKKRLALLRRRIREERPRLPAIFQHPCQPHFQVKGLVPQACFVMDCGSGTAATPALYLVLENAVRGGPPFALQFRTSQDSRPEMLASQLMLTMDSILQSAERHVHHASTEHRGWMAGLAKATEEEEKAGTWDLCLSDIRSNFVAQGGSFLYEVPADAVSFNYIAQAVDKAMRQGGGEHKVKKLKPGEKPEVVLPPSSKLTGRVFPVDCVDNWLRICSMTHKAPLPQQLSPAAEQATAAPGQPPRQARGDEHDDGDESSAQKGTSQRLGLLAGANLGGGGGLRSRRNAFSGPPSARVRGKDGSLNYELNPAHSAWRDTFAKSLAGFYLSSLVLGLRDRCADNVMIRATGHVFNVECAALGLGRALAATPGKSSKEREPVPLLPQFLQILGRPNSPRYQLFEKHLLGGFAVLRRYMSTLNNIVEIIVGRQGIPYDDVREAMTMLGDHFFMDCEDANEAATNFKRFVNADKAFWTQCHDVATYPAPPMSDGYFW